MVLPPDWKDAAAYSAGLLAVLGSSSAQAKQALQITRLTANSTWTKARRLSKMCRVMIDFPRFVKRFVLSSLLPNRGRKPSCREIFFSVMGWLSFCGLLRKGAQQTRDR